MITTLRLLLVEDSLLDAKLIMQELRRARVEFTCTHIDTAEDLLAQLQLTGWDLVISDYSLPGMDALYVIEAIAATGKDIPVIVVSGSIGEDTAVETMKAGADDYLMKDNLTRLGPAIERAIRQAANRKESRQAQQEIMRAKGQLEAFFNSSIQAIYLLSLTGRIQRLNRLARQQANYFFGKEPQTGEPMTAYLLASQKESFAENFSLCKQGEVLFFEQAVEISNAEVRWYQTKFNPVYSGKGDIVGVAYSTFDISERKQAELDTHELRLRMEGIITSAMDAIVTANEDQKIIMVNEAAEKMFGYQADDLLQKPIEVLIPDRFRTAHHSHVKNYGQSGRTNRQMGINMTLYGRRANGNEFPIEASISQVEVSAKKYFTVILRDITLRVEAEHQAKQLNQELLRQNEQLQQFAYITSHNLRGPVATLMGLVNLVERNDGLSAQNHAMIDSMEITVNKLDMVIKDLNTILDYKKELNAIKEQVNLTELCEEVVLLLAKFLDEANCRVESDFSVLAEATTIRSYLHSIFYNMLSNAIKFRDPERALMVKVRSWKEQDNVCISFSDNGLGMDLSRHKNNLFGLYKRFHLQVEGRGLGLHLVKIQVEALNGIIQVESQEGRGTAFTISLPA